MFDLSFPVRLRQLGLTAGVACALSLPAFSQVLFVDDDAAPGGSGLLGWNDALQNPQDAFALPQAQTHEIWVAEGIYKPTNTANRNATFQLPNSARVYGGFRGDELTRDDRAGLFATTILSGDIDGTPGLSAFDSLHVVTIESVDFIEFDGFTIQNGNANDPLDNHGGGMQVTGNSMGSGVHIPILRNCTFRDNSAGYGGGLSAGFWAVMPLSFCNFINNSATVEGGGAWFFDRIYSGTNPALDNLGHNLTFTGNRAPKGGGLYIGNVPTYTEFSNCLFAGNLALEGGGGIWVEGAGVNLFFDHCTIAFNKVVAPRLTGNEGAGIYFGTSNQGSFTPYHLENSIVYDNLAYAGSDVEKSSLSGPGIVPSALAVTYSDIWRSDSLPWAGTGNIEAYPSWTNGSTLTLTLQGVSPCLDAGLNSLIKPDALDLDNDGDVSEQIPIELRHGRPRIGQFATQPGSPPPVLTTDMGCYENGGVFSGS